MKPNIFDLSFESLRKTMLDWNEPEYRVQQIWQGLYQNFWETPAEFSPLPLPLREMLDQQFNFGSLVSEKELISEDGLTRKSLYRLFDQTAIETVLMSYPERHTVCISSQVGCAMGCGFCATGGMGFFRNLSRGEIVEQVQKSAVLLQEKCQSITNVVFMGMGEPFHNYQNVMSAIGILNDSRGFGLGARRFTISTVGLVPGIRQFSTKKSQINLAISLHAADDQLRSALIPINQTYPLPELMAACDDYISTTNRRISVEWALIEGVNDSIDQAKKLVDLLHGKLFHVNLIQLNPVRQFKGGPSTDRQAHDFLQVLKEDGIPSTIRLRRGVDIQAGCGQLASTLG